MKTSGIVDRGEDTIRNFEKVEQGGTHTALPWEGVFQVAVKGQGLSSRNGQERSLQYNL